MVDWRTDDRELLARILTAEAGNQGPIGMTAAGNVIMNRANTTGYGNGVRGVIMKPGQFSPMNSVTGYARGEQGQNIDAIRPNETAYTIADNLLSGKAKDITGGATHFYNPDISNPSWAKGKEFKRIGDHVFGSADAGRQIAAETMQVLGKKPQGILAPTQTSETESKPMMQEDKPRGLLGSLGIQKMQEGAAGETGQRFYERDTFKDTAATLAQGFAAMGSRPGLQKMAANIAAERSESKAKNKTVEFLRKSGREDLAAAVESGSLGARDAAGVLFSQPKDDRTAMMKNYEFYISQGMSQEEAMRAVQSGTTINMPGAPTIGTIPQGYQAIQDPQTGAYRLEVLPGGPAEAEAKDAEARKAALEAQTGQKETVVASAIDRLVGQIDKGGLFNLPEAGIAGNALGRMGVNQEAVDFRNELSSIEGNIAFDRLQQMREASKTGGALGAVSERELTLLMNAYGNINQSTSPARLRENLLTIKRIMTEIENDPVASQFYYGQGGSSPAQTQSNGVSVGEPY